MDQRVKILELLQKNARLTATKISKMLLISEKEVTEIIQDFEKKKVIRGYYTLVNEENLGTRKVRALIEVSMVPERDKGFDRIAQKHFEISRSY